MRSMKAASSEGERRARNAQAAVSANMGRPKKANCTTDSTPIYRSAASHALARVDGARSKRRSLRRARRSRARRSRRLVGRDCNLDDLISDIRDDLRARPYELVFVAGGYQLRTKPRYADAIRALNNGARDAGPPELTPTEIFAVTAIAYLQPATRAELSRLAGREISRDVIGALKRHGLIAAGPRAPKPGAPYAYVTTKKFLEVFGLATLRDLPDIEQLEDAGLLERPGPETYLDDVFGAGEEYLEPANEAGEYWE